MFGCYRCGATQTRQEFTAEVFVINGEPILVDDIPATLCARCGEANFSRETTERIRRMLHMGNRGRECEHPTTE